MPVTELTAQQLGYFERESAHTLAFSFIYPLKDNRRRAIEKKLVSAYCQTGDFGPGHVFGTWPAKKFKNEVLLALVTSKPPLRTPNGPWELKGARHLLSGRR